MKKIIPLLLTVLCLSSCLSLPVYAAAVSDVRITAQPAKLTYTAGESFDPSGMVITVTYADGTSVPAKAADYIYTPSGPLSPVHTAVVIDCAGKKLTLPITVTAATGTIAAVGTEQASEDLPETAAATTKKNNTNKKNNTEQKTDTAKNTAAKVARTDRQGQNWNFFHWTLTVLLIAAVAVIFIAYYHRNFTTKR